MVQSLANILTSWAIYGLYASGLTMVFGIMEVLNGAQATVFGVTAVSTLALIDSGTPLWLSLIAALALAAGLNLAVDRVAFRPLRYRGGDVWGSSSHMIPLMTSLAAGSIIEGLTNLKLGVNTRYLMGGGSFLHRVILIGGARIQAVVIVEIVAAMFVMAFLQLFIARSGWGREVRALAERLDTPQLLGINPERRIVELIALSGLLAGIAAIFWTLSYGIAGTSTGSQINVIGFVLIVLGGMGSISGAVLGALLIATLQVVVARYWISGYETLVVDVVLFVVLIVRPTGLSGRSRTVATR